VEKVRLITLWLLDRWRDCWRMLPQRHCISGRWHRHGDPPKWSWDIGRYWYQWQSEGYWHPVYRPHPDFPGYQGHWE